MAAKKITKGLRFRASVADANPLWETVRKSGREAWICVCVDEPFEYEGRTIPSDFAGEERAFSNDFIRRAVEMEALWSDLASKDDQWWEKRKVGEVIHYNSSFEQYVRTVVVEHQGKKMLKPIALVGDWPAYDLPMRRPDGSVTETYWSKRLKDPQPWQPSVSTLYESDDSECVSDPRDLDPIDFSIPDMTRAEAKQAKLVRACEDVLEILRSGEYQTEPKEALGLVIERAQAALNV